MLSVKVLRVVDELLRDVMRNDLPMGGKFVVPPSTIIAPSSPPPPSGSPPPPAPTKAKYEPARPLPTNQAKRQS